MDRKQLKQLFSTVNQGDKLKVNYNGGLSEDYTVKERKVWKGKGGSILLECTRDRDGSSERVGTFSADSIVNVSLNGTAEVGLPTNTVLPKIFKADPAKSVALKTQFLALKNLTNVEVLVESASEPSIAGNFRVEAVRKTPGRCGPVVLDLVNIASGEKSVLSAVRHSGIIDRVTVTTSNTIEVEDTENTDEEV